MEQFVDLWSKRGVFDQKEEEDLEEMREQKEESENTENTCILLLSDKTTQRCPFGHHSRYHYCYNGRVREKFDIDLSF